MTSNRRAPHVLIVGAGLAGLLLAQALRKKGITFEIFERDQGIHARFQGWAILLQKILPDLRESVPEDLGPIEQTNHLLPLDLPSAFKIYHDGKLVSTLGGLGVADFLRANRHKLRDYLVQGIDVKWDHHWTRIEETADSVTLHFRDGSSVTGDILIGADGVNIRDHLLSGVNPLNIIPIVFLTGETTVAKKDYERLLELGSSAFVVRNVHNQSLIGALGSVAPDTSSANMYWSVTWVDHSLSKGKEAWTHSASREVLHAAALEHTDKIEPKFTEILRLTKPEEMLSPPIALRDVVLDSLPESRITIIGDAAHAMAPFRGEGGNLAMQDSLDLARTIEQIKNEGADRDQTLSLLNEFQIKMLERARPVVLGSRNAGLNPTDNRFIPYKMKNGNAEGGPARTAATA